MPLAAVENHGDLRMLPFTPPPTSRQDLRVPFDLSKALHDVQRPTGAPSTGEKRQYSDDLSRVFSEALEHSMRTHFPKTSSGEGTGTNAASAVGIKSVDVAFNIEGLFLGLGL